MNSEIPSMYSIKLILSFVDSKMTSLYLKNLLIGDGVLNLS